LAGSFFLGQIKPTSPGFDLGDKAVAAMRQIELKKLIEERR